MIELRVEIADTHAKCAEGLMYRSSLDKNSGMLFKFQQPQVLNFWGVNTFIPLDVAFVDTEGKIQKIGHIKPMSDSAVSSDTDCHIAIEANMDFFSNNGISKGDVINVQEGLDGMYVVFEKNEGDNEEKSQIRKDENNLDKWFQQVVTTGIRPRHW